MFSEKDLEDYICDNVDDFMSVLCDVLPQEIADITFLGRQVAIDGKVADLCFEAINYILKNDKEIELKYLVIVELKKNSLCTKDVSQLINYINLAKNLDLYDNVFGVLLGSEVSRDLKVLNDFYYNKNDNLLFMKFDHDFSFFVR